VDAPVSVDGGAESVDWSVDGGADAGGGCDDGGGCDNGGCFTSVAVGGFGPSSASTGFPSQEVRTRLGARTNWQTLRRRRMSTALRGQFARLASGGPVDAVPPTAHGGLIQPLFSAQLGHEHSPHFAELERREKTAFRQDR
jgi:hypothetical protein